ncbi:MAG: response regulator [bacterium]
MPRKKNILIVEDEKPMSRALVLKLNRAGYDTFPAYDGNEALQAMKKQKFDLILLDLIMPKMDGFTMLEKLNKQKNKIPIIVSSNLSQEIDFDRAKKMGAKEYFVKSDTPIASVIEHVKRALDS